MSLFAIILEAPNPEVEKLVRESYPNHYPFSETVFLISQDTLAETVAQTVGIKGDNRIEVATGAIFKLSGAYAGYASRALWEWLEKVEGDSA